MIAVVDYGMGNLRSVAKAFEAVGADVRVASRPEDLADAERIVLPGVGAFGDGMANLVSRGFVDQLRREVLERRKPLLGICLGMQMLAEEGTENGAHKGLGFIPGRVVALTPSDPTLKIPHMGWNDVTLVDRSFELWKGLPGKPTFYFAHTYRFDGCPKELVAATCNYGGEFAVAVRAANVFATQFHPEKSQQNGLRLLRQFAHWTPTSAATGAHA